MTIDWTINITNILSMVGMVIGAVAVMVTVRSDIDGLKRGADSVDQKLAQMAAAITAIARAEEKIAGINKRIDDEKEEGQEFRHWLRGEIARIWSSIGDLSKQIARGN